MSLRDEIKTRLALADAHQHDVASGTKPDHETRQLLHWLAADVRYLLGELDKHSAPVADAVPEPQSSQPLSKPKGLPAWRDYLRQLRREGIASGRDRDLYPKLVDLERLRRTIGLDRGMVTIPEGVARCMTIRAGGHHPAGIYRWDGDEWMHSTDGATYSAPRDYVLTALDSYADGLVCGT